MQNEWDESQLTLFEMQANTSTSDARSTPTTPSERPGLTLTKQLDFEDLWAYRLKAKYGIDPAFAEEDDDE